MTELDGPITDAINGGEPDERLVTAAQHLLATVESFDNNRVVSWIRPIGKKVIDTLNDNEQSKWTHFAAKVKLLGLVAASKTVLWTQLHRLHKAEDIFHYQLFLTHPEEVTVNTYDSLGIDSNDPLAHLSLIRRPYERLPGAELREIAKQVMHSATDSLKTS